jgi:hypothetical protein
MNVPPTIAGLSWLLAALAPLPAQQEPMRRGNAGADPRAAVAARSGFCCAERHGDRIVATGRDWRAIATRAGVEFHPALGRTAQAVPVLYAFADEAREGVEPVLDGHTITFAHGNATERYEVRPEGLELSITYAARPATTGDLVVKLRVEAAMKAESAADGALVWRLPGSGGVRLGGVTGVDAQGRRCAGELRHNGGEVEMRLPQAFVDGATWPVTLDPLIGTVVESLPNQDCDFPDVAYDPFTDSYCVVFTLYFGSNQSGVVGSVHRRSDLARQYAFQVNQQGNQDQIRVASIGGSAVFLLVWVNVANNAAEISGLGLDPGQATATAVFQIAGPGAVGEPAIGGEATPFGTACVVIWKDAQAGIVGSTVDVDVNLQVSLGPFVTIGGGASAQEPCISKQGGGPGQYVIAWIDRPAGLPGHLRAQVVDYTLALFGPAAWIRNVPANVAHPAVDGDGFLFLIAWDEQETLHPSSTDVFGRLLTVAPAGITTQGPVLDVAVYPLFVDGFPDVAMLGDKFGVVYETGLVSPLYSDDVYFRTFARNGTPIGGEFNVDLNTGGHYVYEHGPRLIGCRDGDYASTAVDGLMAFADQDVQTIDSDVGLQAVASMGPGGAVSDQGGGCGPAGLAVATGAFALGNQDFRVELFGAPVLAVPFLGIGFAPAPALVCGACTLTNPASTEFVPNTAGTAARVLPLPGSPDLLGLTVEFQWLLFNVAYVGCPFAPGLAASNRLRATLGY